ncbi:MAG: dephospho-CoA kinase [Anaerolineae bacterium]|nr:dephospho-CoA kinase [Anaerolineae bacterium]
MSRWENKYVIGLTGNIAVGKSVVRQMLQHLGAYTIDADGLSHQAMMPGAPAYKPVIDMFGRFLLDEEGRINRARLGSVVFAMPEALSVLETIVHPVVNQAIVALVGRARQPVVVVEAIKLLETDLANMVDAIWVVDASLDTQLKRLIDKRKMSEEDARKRLFAQPPQMDKLALADVIIKNDENVEETWKQVQTAWGQIRRQIGEAPTQLHMKLAAQPQPSSLPPIPRQPATPSGSGQLAATNRNLVDPKTQIVVRRGMPGNAETIASFISLVTGKHVGRMDVMLAFGQKSYHLAYGKNDQVIALLGWTVENLITRVDEFYIAPNVPYTEIIRELIGAIEDASRELQSEVCFVALPNNTAQGVFQAFEKTGYQLLNLNEVKFPAWREAAHEMIADHTVQAFMKQLRADRVMKPI